MAGILPSYQTYNVEQIENMKVIYGFNKFDQASVDEATKKQKKFHSRGGKVNLVYSPTGRPATDDDLTRFPDKVHIDIVYMNRGVSKPSHTSTSKTKATSSKSSTKKSDSKKPAAVSASKATRKVGRPRKDSSSSPTRNEKEQVPFDSPGTDEKALVNSGPAPEPELVALGGWTKKSFLRKTGASKGNIDKYWYSPQLQKKFRSMLQVRKFLRCLEMTSGDEKQAFKMYKDRTSL